MSSIAEDINNLKLSDNIKSETLRLYDKIEGRPKLVGDSASIDGYFVETHPKTTPINPTRRPRDSARGGEAHLTFG